MDPTNILIDTSIIIEHFRKSDKQTSTLYRIVDLYNLHLSTIAEFELWAGATDAAKRHDIETILKLCKILPFTSDVAQQASTIYQFLRPQNLLIDIRDIFIAATSLTFDLPLLTLNQKHFTRIPGVKFASFS